MRLVGQAHHHSVEEVERYVLQAKQIAADAVTENLDAATIFTAVLPLLASKQMAFEQAAPGSVLLEGLRGGGH